jgi:hypothetical protein
LRETKVCYRLTIHNILLQLDHFYFVAAAVVCFAVIHSALAAFFRLVGADLPGMELIHAEMQVYHEARVHHEVNKAQYGYQEFLHFLLRPKITLLFHKRNNETGYAKMIFIN